MMWRVAVSFILVLILGCAHSAPNGSVSSQDTQGLRLIEENLKHPTPGSLSDDEIRTILLDNVGFGQQADGIVVGVVDERGPRAISAGVMGDAAARAVDGDTLFRIGSITKVFTALLLQDMLERGQMKLDDPVQLYLPDSVKMPTHGGKRITVFDLATHMSALPRDWDAVPGPTDTIEQFYAKLSRVKLRRDPGSEYEYSNLAVSLLGHIIARKAGKDYETLVIERICRPLGMDSTRITLTPQLEARLATGHGFPGKPTAQIRGASLMPGAGSLKSTANDLLKFVSAHLGLSASPLQPLMKKVTTIQQSASGRSGRLIWVEDAGAYVHGGLVSGFRTNLAFDPAKRRGIVILANCSSGRVPVALLGPFLQRRSPRPPKTTPIDENLLDGFVGQYQFKGPKRSAAVLSARRDGKRLLLQVWHGQPPYPMPFLNFEAFAQSETVFYDQTFDNRITFVRDASGQATKVIVSNPRERVQNAIGKRISSQPSSLRSKHIDSPLYHGFIGRYRPAFLGLIPFGPTLNIYLKTDDLGPHLIAYLQGLSEATDQSELFPFSESLLYTPDLEDCSLTFKRDRSGKANGIIVQMNDREIRGVRVSDDPELPEH